ncbi:MAG: TldD/PmbA family protein [Firmicutes bacterium]|nr:TldD/PmbA family protein [Bacillota bacterium]
MERERMAEILACARRRGVEAEVFASSSRETTVQFENNRLKRVETSERSGMAVRVIDAGRLGFATSSLPANPVRLLEEAIATAEFGKKVGFSFPQGPLRQEAVAIFDEEVAEIGPEDLAALGEELIAPLRQAAPKFKAMAALGATRAKIALANTAGFSGEMEKTFFGGTVGGILVEGENFLDLAETHLSCEKTDRLRLLRDRVLDQLRHGRRNVPLSSGKYPVLFAPTAVASLLGPFVASLNGKAVQKGASPFRGRLGEKAFAEAFSLIDDGLRAYSPPSAPFDAEGVPNRVTPLIERGVIRNYLVDLDTAEALALPPNGNARRGGWASPPAPGPSTLLVPAGEARREDLLGNIGEGLLVHHFLGAGQGNPYGGVVSANVVLGFFVRNGEIAGRIKNTMLTIDVFALFRERLLAISRETEEVRGSMVLPFVLADGIDVTVD